VNLISLSHGCAVGWLSPFLPYLKSNNSHLITGPITDEDASWIGSLIALGGFVGSITFGKVTEIFGKKIALFLLVFPHFGFWSLVFFSTHVHHLYLARFIAGITGGGIYRTISLFVAEISENNVRGMLGSWMVFALSGGALMIFTVGTYVDFFTVPLMIVILPSIFLASLFLLHDTPMSLIARGKQEEAFESLKFYRTCCGVKTHTTEAENLLREFNALKESFETKHQEKLGFKDFCESITELRRFFKLFFCSSFSYKISKKGTAYWVVFNVCQSVFWFFRPHDIHGRHFQKFRFKFDSQRVVNHRSVHSTFRCLLFIDYR
jgi:MFS family permease